ncbi:MAG: peptidoglycan DD-metalloendopeptidase family protein [Saprospiraceae bacterium]|nr:peptidoglycan DD-metalloendopeptidase family protein [Saprospiraceae bacterium]
MKKWITKAPSLLIQLCFLFLMLPILLEAQSKKDLENKRKKIIRDIAATEQMIKKTKENKDATYDRYLALQSQIQNREILIQTLQSELIAAEEGITRNKMVISSLNDDLVKMRADYGRIVRSAFRQKTISNPLLYILSADNLNQAFRRWLFLRKYDKRRREQALAIAATQAMLARKSEALEISRTEKETLLGTMESQREALRIELGEKDKMLKFLYKDESRLKTDLEKKQAAHEELNKAIEKIITEEVRKRVDEARKAKPAVSKPLTADKPVVNTNTVKKEEIASETVVDNSAEIDLATLQFLKSKGRLPWPVESGFISRRYGRQKHPTLKNIEITNNGIDIRTKESALVRAIFDGRVAGIQYIPGHDYTVIIQHGDYYTVYSNLSETNLSKDENVSANEAIGLVSNNPITGSSELHFELWHQKERVDPSTWIKK